MQAKNKKTWLRRMSKPGSIASIVFSGQVGFKKLAKATFIFTAAPAMIILVFIVNGYIDVLNGSILFGLIFLVALLFNYPYIADLQEVTNYVNDVADNKSPEKPDLSFLNNVEELSEAVDKLNSSWQERNDALKILLLEDEILINSLPNIIVMLDSELNFLQTNQAAKNTFGWNYGETIKKIIEDSSIKSHCVKVLESGDGANIKYELADAQHYFFNIRIEKFPINSPNKIALILILQNLTQEKKTERMLSDFVSNASHEMKTPLASISGFIETLAEHENDAATQKEFLKIMKEQSDRMNKLISELLTLSLIESGTSKAKFEKIKLNEVLDEAVVNLQKMAQNRDIKIKAECDNSLPKIMGNRDEMSRVLDNLISNAIKYSPEGSDVVVRIFKTSNSQYNFDKFPGNQNLVCASVIDSGEGIDEKNLPRLTERFFRVDKARSRNVGGTGLGLSIVKHIIENHDGLLEIKSKLGQGSTFSVYLPALEEAPIV